MNAPDLTKYPPRSPRCRLGGFALLPRLIDKCRASIAGTPGEYHYNCPLDRQFFDFTGIDHEQLKTEAATGKGDGELLQWILANMPRRYNDAEIAQWSAWRDAAVPADHESRAFFNGIHEKIAPNRTDVRTWCDLLDIDDFVSFGGKA
jgi:hypothetical protein